MKAIFKGKNGSLRYETNHVYDIDVAIEGQYIIVRCAGHNMCPYSIVGFNKNWQFI